MVFRNVGGRAAAGPARNVEKVLTARSRVDSDKPQRCLKPITKTVLQSPLEGREAGEGREEEKEGRRLGVRKEMAGGNLKAGRKAGIFNYKQYNKCGYGLMMLIVIQFNCT